MHNRSLIAVEVCVVLLSSSPYRCSLTYAATASLSALTSYYAHVEVTVSGVGTVAAVAALAATLVRP